MTPTVHILILAAGASSRMRGTDKLVQMVGDDPMLRHVSRVALATGSPVAVTLPPASKARAAALAGLALDIVPVPDAACGMSRSLAAGINAIAPKAGARDGVMILPADMPALTSGALTDLITRFQSDPLSIQRGADSDGRPGHPVIFPHDLWPALQGLTGDEGGRSVLQQNMGRVRVIALPGSMAVLDLDTPEDWAAWKGDAP